MDSMDYQMESSPYQEPPTTFRRCPYAAYSSNPNNFSPAASHTRTHHFQNAFAFAPAHHFHHPLAWAHATYPLLPPPTPTNINIHNHYGHSHLESFSRGTAEQSSTQNTTMAENRGDESHPWLSAGAYLLGDEDQSDPQESGSSSSSEPSSTTAVFGGINTDTRSNENTFQPRMLPPIFPPADRYSLSEQTAQAIAGRSDQEPGRIHRNDINSSPPATRPRSAAHNSSGTGTRGSGVAQAIAAASQRVRVLPPRYGYENHHYEAMTARAADEEPLSPPDLGLHNFPWLEALIDRQVGRLENEESMRMDDPARLDYQARRRRLEIQVLSQYTTQTKKSGASKAALESLVKVPISNLKEDDRTCQICYNDYGVENPDGIKENPIQMPKCEHVFGEICLKKWFEDKSTCPYCRDQLPSDPHRAQRSHAASRRFRSEHSMRDYMVASARSNARVSGLPNPRTSAWADTTMSRRSDLTDDYGMLRRSEAVFQHQDRPTDLSREIRADPTAFPGRATARRSRGRPSGGRAPYQNDLFLRDMRASTASDPPQMPMRVPIGSAAETYGHRPTSSFGARTPRPGQNAGISPGIPRVPSTSQEAGSLYGSTPASVAAHVNTPYATHYPASFSVQQNENMDSSMRGRGYSQFSVGSSPNSTSRTYEQGSSTSRVQPPSFDPYEDYTDREPPSYQHFLPAFPIQTHLANLQAAEADEERRALQGIRETAGSVSQQLFNGFTEAHPNGSQSTRPYSSEALIRDSYGDLTPHRAQQQQGHTQTSETNRQQPQRLPNANPTGAGGNYADDRYPGIMPPPRPSTTHSSGDVDNTEYDPHAQALYNVQMQWNLY